MEIDIPENIKNFIDQVVDSFVMWDLLIFSSQRSGGVDAPQRTAQLLGRTEVELERPFSKLMELGIFVTEKQQDGGLIYRMNQQSPFFVQLQQFISFNSMQENRLRILSYLLQKKAD